MSITIQRLLERRSVPYAAAAAVVLAALLIYVDFETWIELDVAILYGLPLVLAALARRRGLMWVLAAGLLCVTFVVYGLQAPAGAFAWREPFFLNRVLDALAVLLTAGLLHALTLATEQIGRQNERIRQQNDELDRRRRHAEAASARKSRLLASVSHDIGTPLTSINVISQLIRARAGEPGRSAEVRGLADLLEASAQSLGELLSDLLDLSAIESGTLELHETSFSLNDLLAEECRLLDPLARSKGLRLTLEPAPPLWLRADRTKLARVLRNLLTNAIKFTAAGEVSVGCARANAGVLVRVADTGAGIAAPDLERIFVEFTQLRAAGSEESQGWGLGLAICKRLIELMGGKISVASELGKGSVFTLHLPEEVLETAAPPLLTTTSDTR